MISKLWSHGTVKFYTQETPCSPLGFFLAYLLSDDTFRRSQENFAVWVAPELLLDCGKSWKSHPRLRSIRSPLPLWHFPCLHRAWPCPSASSFAAFSFISVLWADRISHPEPHTLLQHQRAAGDEWQWWQLLRGTGKGQLASDNLPNSIFSSHMWWSSRYSVFIHLTTF